MQINSIEEVTEALKNGEIVIVTDNPNRENEGDGGKAFGDEFLPWK